MISQPPVFLAQSAPRNLLQTQHGISSLVNLMPPLGLLSIAAYLKRSGLKTHVFDFNAYPGSLSSFRKALTDEQPHWLGLSCVTSTFNGGLDIVRHAKTIKPDIKVVLGGPHVSALKEAILDRYPEIDVIVVGEGERTFCQLIAQGMDRAGSIRGLIYRDGSGRPRFTGNRTEALELDSLPYPDYDALKGFPERYRTTLFNYPRTPSTSIISSRGCPYACSYCDRSVFGRSFRYNSAGYLFDHMKYLRINYGIRHLTFYDDQFTFNRSRVTELCHKLIKNPLGMTYNCAVRAEHVDSQLLRLMKRAGCWMISVGIETGDPDLLAKHRSKGDIEALAECIRKIKSAGIRAKGLFMMGLPGETEKSISLSRRLAFSLPLDDLNMTKFTPFPGSPLYEKAEQLGTFDENWDRMDCMSFQFVPPGFTRERLETIHSDFYRSHFMRPKMWLHYLKMAAESPDSWRRFLAHSMDYLEFAFGDKQS